MTLRRNIIILFAEDWAKYPTAIADTQTTNRSFVRMARVYKAMGIKNHTFLLALVNPQLVGVNPFDPNLSRDHKNMIIAECKMNPWYYFREIARVPGGSGEEPTPLEANRGNIALWWCFFNHIMVLLIQPRQTGKSLCTDELMVYLMNVLCLATTINLMTKDEKLRKENITRMKAINGELPPYLNQRNLKKDINNTEELSIVSLANKYLTHLPQSSEKAAWNVGRGFTSNIIQMDEPPYCPNIHISMPVMLSSAGAARERAARSGSPYGTILTTTAGQQDSTEGKFIFDILQESMVWTELLFDATNEANLMEIVKKNGHGLYQINATFSHRQLGKTDAWLDERLKASKSTGESADRDYFNVWTSGTSSHPLPAHLLRAIKLSEDTDPYMEIDKIDNFIIRWYLDEDQVDHYHATRKCVLGIDTSEAISRDDIGLVFTDVETLEVIGAATINEINILIFATWLCRLLVKYKNITTVIERRSTGGAIMDVLILMLTAAGEDPFRRIYNKVIQEADEDPERYNEIRQPMNRRDPYVYTKNRAAFGFATSGSGATARSKLYSTVLQNGAKRGGDRVRDKTLISQLMGLMEKNGRVDHASGAHDDMVVAWLLTHWFLMEGVNLAWYGIERAMTDIATHKKLTPQEQQFRNQQNALQEKMRLKAEEMTEATDEYVSMALEHELRVMARGIVYENGQVNSVDQLINSIKEAKKTKRSMASNRAPEQSDDDYYKSMLRLGNQYQYY